MKYSVEIQTAEWDTISLTICKMWNFFLCHILCQLALRFGTNMCYFETFSFNSNLAVKADFWCPFSLWVIINLSPNTSNSGFCCTVALASENRARTSESWKYFWSHRHLIPYTWKTPHSKTIFSSSLSYNTNKFKTSRM